MTSTYIPDTIKLIMIFIKRGFNMLYTHEQMKEKFGASFIINVLEKNKIEEMFNTDYCPYKKYDSVEEAKIAVVNQKTDILKKEENKIVELLDNYKSLPFASKIYSFFFRSGYNLHSLALKSLEIKKKKTIEEINTIQNKSAIYLDTKKTYDIEFPDLKVNDEIFLVVENNNVIEVGLYKGKITDLKYCLINDNQVKISGLFSVSYNGEEKHFTLKTEQDHKLSDGFIYHTFFFDEKEAKKYLDESINKKINFFKSKFQSD